LGDLYTAKTVRTAGTVVFIVVGILLVALAIYMFIRSKKVKRMETLGILDDEKTRKINATSIEPSSLSLIDKNTTNADENNKY